jgi:hypothetical protein
MELRRHRFASMEEIQQNASADLKPCKKRTYRGSSSNGRTAGASVHLQKGSTSRLTRLVLHMSVLLQVVHEFREHVIFLYRIRVL